MQKMNSTTTEQTRRMEADRAELAERIGKATPRDGSVEIQPGLFLNRVSVPDHRVYTALQPSLCVIAQGSKKIFLGDECLQYDPAHYLITTLSGLPASGCVIEASPQRPYLGLRLLLDPAVVTSLMVEAGVAAPLGDGGSVRGADVSKLNADLLDATVRLVRLTERQAEYRVLAGLVIREIIYRLLNGAQVARLSQVATLGGQTHRMVRAVERLRQSYDKPLRIETVADELGMSVSGFHAHFKAVTAMSPLQFQKQLRLQEARRLMLSENLDAGEAGFRVGYEDQSHFSRDYKRHFGEPPMRDVERMRKAAAVVV